MEEQFHVDRLGIITAFALEREEHESQAEALREQEVQRHNGEVERIERNSLRTRLSNLSSLLGASASVLSQGNKKMLGISKAFAIAQGLINAYGAYLQALNDPTVPSTVARIALAIAVLGLALKAVASIKGGGGGGGSSGGLSSAAPEPAGQVAAPETSNTTSVNIALRGQVFDRGAVIGLIDQINEAVGDGARIRTV